MKSEGGRECEGRTWKERELKILEFFGKTKPRHELFAAGKRHELGSWCDIHICVLLLPDGYSLGVLVILPSGPEPRSLQKVLDPF